MAETRALSSQRGGGSRVFSFLQNTWLFKLAANIAEPEAHHYDISYRATTKLRIYTQIRDPEMNPEGLSRRFKF
jgi:hypothetical protein